MANDDMFERYQCDNSLWKDVHISLVYSDAGNICLGISRVAAFIFFVGFQAYNRRLLKLEKENSLHIVKGLILPSYYPFIYCYTAFSLIIGVAAMINSSLSPDSHALNIWLIPVEMGISHWLLEGLAFFLLRYGSGVSAIRRALSFSFIWAMITVGWFLVVSTMVTNTYSNNFNIDNIFALLLSYRALLFIFYTVYAVVPSKMLYRRPALTFYARFTAFLELLYMIFLCMYYEKIDGSVCPGSVLSFAFNAIAQPLVIFKTLQIDSQYWQGLCPEEGNPLNDVWDHLGVDTATSMADNLGIFERSAVKLPILHFGLITMDSDSTFVAGGFSRVYFGKLRDEQVAFKILFAMELEPNDIEEFYREASVLYQLQHKNVVLCKGVCIMPPALTLVLERCIFGSLFDFLYKLPPAVQTVSVQRALDKANGSSSYYQDNNSFSSSNVSWSGSNNPMTKAASSSTAAAALHDFNNNKVTLDNANNINCDLESSCNNNNNNLEVLDLDNYKLNPLRNNEKYEMIISASVNGNNNDDDGVNNSSNNITTGGGIGLQISPASIDDSRSNNMYMRRSSAFNYYNNTRRSSVMTSATGDTSSININNNNSRRSSVDTIMTTNNNSRRSSAVTTVSNSDSRRSSVVGLTGRISLAVLKRRLSHSILEQQQHQQETEGGYSSSGRSNNSSKDSNNSGKNNMKRDSMTVVTADIESACHASTSSEHTISSDDASDTECSSSSSSGNHDNDCSTNNRPSYRNNNKFLRNSVTSFSTSSLQQQLQQQQKQQLSSYSISTRLFSCKSFANAIASSSRIGRDRDRATEEVFEEEEVEQEDDIEGRRKSRQHGVAVESPPLVTENILLANECTDYSSSDMSDSRSNSDIINKLCHINTQLNNDTEDANCSNAMSCSNSSNSVNCSNSNSAVNSNNVNGSSSSRSKSPRSASMTSTDRPFTTTVTTTLERLSDLLQSPFQSASSVIGAAAASDRSSMASIQSQTAASALFLKPFVFGLSFRQRLCMMRDAVAAIAFLHSKGFMHCDIKSLNYLVADNYVVKLADMGEARHVSSPPKRERPPIPAKNWAPPEVLAENAEASAYTIKSDIYGLCIVLSEIILLEVPFGDVPDLISVKRWYETLTVDQLRPALPDNLLPSLKYIIQAGWSTDPAARPEAAEILSVIDDILLVSSKDAYILNKERNYSNDCNDNYSSNNTGVRNTFDHDYSNSESSYTYSNTSSYSNRMVESIKGIELVAMKDTFTSTAAAVE